MNHDRVLACISRIFARDDAGEGLREWYWHHQLHAFQGATPAQVVEQGRTDALILHLRSVEAGGFA